MTEVKADKGIPFPGHVPSPQGRPGRPDKYPWLTMDVGDSFPIDYGYYQAACGLVHQANQRFEKAYRIGKRKELRRFAARKVDGGFRIWRVE